MSKATDKVYKYEFPVSETCEVALPAGARVLHVGTQNPGKICMWVEVDPSQPEEKHFFHVRGTGHPIGQIINRQYLGTVFDGFYVWHVYHDGKNGSILRA